MKKDIKLPDGMDYVLPVGMTPDFYVKQLLKENEELHKQLEDSVPFEVFARHADEAECAAMGCNGLYDNNDCTNPTCQLMEVK